MNIGRELSIYDRAKKIIEQETDISFFYGKLGCSISLLYFASKYEIENIYDFALEQFNFCCEELKKTKYSNYDFDLALFGTILENLNRDDVLEVDTDLVLKDVDVYITSNCVNKAFSKTNYKNVISYCYYISSRYANKELTESNFMDYQILILKLIEISCEIDNISLKKELVETDIEILFNIVIFSKYLFEKNICIGLSESIYDKGFEIINNHQLKLNFYEKTLISLLHRDYSEFLELLRNNSTILSITRVYKISKSQLFTLISFLKSPLLSNEKVWDEIRDKVLIFIEQDTLSHDRIYDLSILHGISAYYYFSMNFGECDYARLFSLNNLISSNSPI